VRPVFIIGFMGAGKSTVGGIVAARLGRPFVDLDGEIERREGRTVAELFAAEGESGFRKAERAALAEVARQPGIVVACGGGVATDEDSYAILRESGTVVYLQVSPEEAVARVGSEVHGRPLLRGGSLESAASLLGSRERVYDAVADITVDTCGREPAAIADEVVPLLEGAS
jgi:shikimate kinase